MSTKKSRLNKILNPKTGRTVIIAFDHGVEHGPAAYKNINLDPRRIAKICIKGGADGLMVHAGTARYIKPFIRTPLIIKLTGRTNLSPRETEIQEVVTTVEEAKSIGATAVAFTLYVGADRESEMLKNLSQIKRDCLKFKLPLLGLLYPRSKKQKTKYDPDAVMYAARVGAELGFDVVKTYYTGDKKTFSKVCETSFVPVVAAGGPRLKKSEDVIKMARDVMEAGGAGLAIGRNVWGWDDQTAIRLLKQIRKIVHDE